LVENLTKYFRIESQELMDGLTRGLLDLERQGGRGQQLDQCFRLAHTLKGAAGAVKQPRIAELAHAVEDVLASFRKSGEALPSAHVSELLQLIAAIQKELAQLDRALSEVPESAVDAAARSAADGGRIEIARVEVSDVNDLSNEIAEALVQLGTLRSGADGLNQADRIAALLVDKTVSPVRLRSADDPPGMKTRHLLEELRAALSRARTDINAGLDRIESELWQAQGRARELQLVPAAGALAAVELTIREAAESLGKAVDVEVSGGEIRLNGYITSALREAMLHIARNAVDHGIEAADVRLAAGKPAAGQIQFRVERRGSRVAFVCKDDGRGIDVDAVRSAAARSGVRTKVPIEQLTSDEAMPLIFETGVSTRATISKLSGRGVGLDVARETAMKLKGTVTASSVAGRGTTIEIVVPVSLSSLPALRIKNGDHEVLVPLEAVRGALRLVEGAIVRGEGHDAILYEDRLIPFAPLAMLLEDTAQTRPPRAAIILDLGMGRAALGTERLLGSTTVIVKPLPNAAGSPAVVTGATFDAAGDPVLVLDPKGAIEAIRTAGSTASLFDRTRAHRPPILIVDDSLTTRMLEQSILEAEGYEVDLASSGEEGLQKASARRYSLFLVDVEMPGITGFEFAERIRADEALRHIPLVIVTALTSLEDRRRAAKAGADGYIVKGEFDQRHLLQTVAILLGRQHGDKV
jgi:two-component system, chemotaxis family, sensor kinase CheA